MQIGEVKLKEANDSDDELDFEERKVKFQSENNVEFDDKSSEDADERHTIRTVGSKSEFTNYSLTSSVLRRNEKLNDLDEHFENFFLNDIIEEEDDDDSDLEEDEENNENELFNDLINEHQVEKTKSAFQAEDVPKDKILKMAEQQLKDEEANFEELEEVELRLATGKNEYDSRWDCQSVLSNYSNIYNRPKLILEQQRSSNKININKHTGMPEESNKLTEKVLKQFNRQKDDDDKQTIRTTTSLISQLSIRNKDESKKEKQLRKKNLKEYRKDRRLEKKANKLAFQHEDLRINNQKVTNHQLAALKF